jgi:hypothetical protein
MVSESSKSIHRTVYLWARELAHYTEVKNPGMIPVLLQPLASKLASLLDNNGRTGTITYLKVSLFVLYSFMSGNPLRSTVPLGWGIRLRNGLPADWSVKLRTYVRSGNAPMIRIIASLLNIYRAMDAKHPKYSVDTIERPHPDLKDNPDFKLFQKFCTEILPTLLSTQCPKNVLPTFEYKSAAGLLIKSAGANYSPAMASMVEDAQAWANAPSNYIAEWFKLHEDKYLLDLVTAMAKEVVPLPGADALSSLNGYGMASRPSGPRQGSEKPILGRLHTIDEPAGKVRVVAICDYWTQVGLKPVHDWLFSILKHLPQDATFDQDGRTVSYYQKGLSPHWSFDLKSATDLIPLALYKEVLGPIMRSHDETLEQGRARAELWAKIIADRDFALPNDGKTPTAFVRYRTGQPMGALSSWASMAMVHHALVQFSSWKVDGCPSLAPVVKVTTRAARKAAGRTREIVRYACWYEFYLVLGDDVDISRMEAVATAYTEVCASFSIIIGLHKSLKSSKNCFEFANRRFHPIGDISPISFREELSARTWVSRWEYAKRICSRLGKTIEEVPAVLRRAVTSAQWSVILPEMAGKRPSSLLSLVRYCLLNPLQLHKDVAEVRISHLLDWLANGLDANQARVARSVRIDTEQGRQLERSLAHFLLGKIQDEFDTRLSESYLAPLRKVAPPVDRFKDSDLWHDSAERAIPSEALAYNSLWRQVTATIELPEPPKAIAQAFWDALETVDDSYVRSLQKRMTPNYYAKQSPIAWAYFLSCINLHNSKVLQDLFEIEERYNQAVRRTPPVNSPVYSKKFYQRGYPNLVGPLLEILIDLLTLPKLIKYDLNKSMVYNLGTNMDMISMLDLKMTPREFALHKDKLWSRAIEPEILYGPMQALANFLARELGIIVPNIPFFALSKGQRHWTRSLNRQLAYFKRRELLLQRYNLGLLFYSKLSKVHAPWANVADARPNAILLSREARTG